MFLKSVSLYGFKTFAVKTDFEFKPGLTAIVGPNGCGKSNLFDAVVWVLGEQSMRSLRGRKMEEVVFHGSDAKRPLGFAQVKLTFDNEEGYFPLPHSEISIVRRFFKSGDSEFEINGQPCRLKDIHNLLLDTGMGKLNYSIINQGDVEYIIGLNPTDRRVIFDEAAGINKFKIEKKKTLQKIKDTDQNVARLRDLLTDIEERLEPLRLQAEQAKRYEDLMEQIERLKLRVMAAEIKRLIDQVSAHGDAENEVRGIEENARARIKEYREKRAGHRELLAAAQVEFSAAGQNLGQLKGRLEHHQQALDFLRNAITQSRQAKERLENELRGYDARAGELRAEIENLKKRRETNTVEIAQFDAQLKSALQTTGEDTGGDGEEAIGREISALRNELDALRGSLEERRAAVSRATDRAESLGRGLTEKNAEIQKAEHTVKGIVRRLEQSRAERDSARAEADAAAGKIEKLRAEQRTLRLEEEDLSAQRDEARSALAYQRARAEHLAAVSRAAEKQTGDEPDGLSLGADRPLPLELEIDPGYEPAVRRALGAVLDAWVVPATGSIKKLTPRQAGELLFLLADALPQAPAAPIPGEIGRLSDFARAAGDLAAPAARLLARYAVVESTDSVPGLAGSIPAGLAAVTKSGDALLQNGILFLGEGLGGREEMKKLAQDAEAAIARDKETIRVIDNRLADLRDNRKRVERELENADRETQKLNLRHVERTSEITALEKEKQFHEQNLEMLTAAVADIERQRAAFDAEKQTAGQALDSGQQQFQSIKQELDRKETLLNEMLDTRRQRQAMLQDLRMKLNDRANDNRSIEDNVAYREKEIERAVQQAESRHSERARLDAEIESRMAEFEASRGGGDALAQQVAQAQKELTARQEQLNEHERAIKQYESDIDDMDQAANDARDQIQQIQIKRARTEAQLEEQRRVFSEEFPGTDEAAALEEAAEVQPGERAEYKRYRKELEDMGPVNMLALGEYDDEKQRYDLLASQLEDLQDTRSTLLDMVEEYDNRSRSQFLDTFNAINEKFKETFKEIFEQGGDAEIQLTNPNDPLESGVEIAVQMPGKRMRNIHLLSGGEKALTALTLIFAILKVKPSPFYLLDEVDAGLDESNVAKFKRMLMTYSKQAQFLVITHNKGTLIGADHYYGITMDSNEGYTKVLSVSLEQ